MPFRTLPGLLLILLTYACAQRTPKGRLPIKSGLKIENSPTRGTGFTDSLGTKYGLVYITATITNDRPIPIQIQLDFAKGYDYPAAYGDAQFNIILPPSVFALDGVEITDSQMQALPKLTGKSSLIETLKPGEKHEATIGILRPVRKELCSATPYALFEYRNTGDFPSCDWPSDEGQPPNSQFALGLKVGFCTTGLAYKSCTFIPCGQISYPEY